MGFVRGGGTANTMNWYESICNVYGVVRLSYVKAA